MKFTRFFFSVIDFRTHSYKYTCKVLSSQHLHKIEIDEIIFRNKMYERASTESTFDADVTTFLKSQTFYGKRNFNINFAFLRIFFINNKKCK